VSTSSFGGFQSGSRATAVPNVFFTTILPQIADPIELLVTCYLFFVFGRQRGVRSVTSMSALLQERPLIDALRRLSPNAEHALRNGLDLAATRGTVLRARDVDSGEAGYLLNTETARKRVERLPADAPGEADPLAPLPPAGQRPNIYALYEENIGSLSPLLVDELDEAEQSYAPAWIEAAFREAAANNRRSWRYISRILQRWSIEGPDYEASGRRAPLNPGGRRRTIGGPYRRVVERRD